MCVTVAAQNPYLLNAGTTAFHTGVSVIAPIAERTVLPPRTWDYMLWKDIFVAPIVTNTTVRTIEFPAGNNWVDWWNMTIVYSGNTTITYQTPLEIFPVFFRQGALLPLQVNNSLAGHGDEFSAEYMTLLAAAPALSDRNNQTLEPLLQHDHHHHEQQGAGYTAIREFRQVSQEVRYLTTRNVESSTKSFTLLASAHPRKLILLVRTADLSSQGLESAVDVAKIVDVVDRLNDRPLRQVHQWGAFSKGCGWLLLCQSSQERALGQAVLGSLWRACRHSLQGSGSQHLVVQHTPSGARSLCALFESTCTHIAWSRSRMYQQQYTSCGSVLRQ